MHRCIVCVQSLMIVPLSRVHSYIIPVGFLKFVNSDERIFRHCRFCYRDHHCIGVDSLIDSQIFMISFVQHAIQTEDNQ